MKDAQAKEKVLLSAMQWLGFLTSDFCNILAFHRSGA
jgi:hypothetical protein